MDKNRKLSIEIAKEVSKLGGAVYYVGGCVRDEFLHRENKDIDIEVYGISPLQLKEICRKFGDVDEVGISFGVLKIHGYDLDISMPRTEQAVGNGHKDFSINVDQFMTTDKAAERRDFTINALMKNVLTKEIIDHFDGLMDIEYERIRHINDKSFIEDPLRVFRAAGFASRLNFIIFNDTVELCKNINVADLSKERIFEETNKVLLKAEKPSIYFKRLLEMNHLKEFFPSIEALINIQQDPIHHPEGDAFAHTMIVIDHAAKFRNNVSDPLSFMYAALYHDIGKKYCAKFDEKREKWVSINHENVGAEIVEKELNLLTNDKKIIKYVKNMIQMHMYPHLISEKNSLKTTNRMLDKSINPYDLILLSYCDKKGRGKNLEDKMEWWKDRIEKYEEVIKKPEVNGNDLILLGYQPGPMFSKILNKCHDIHLAGVCKEDVIKQLPSIVDGIKKKK